MWINQQQMVCNDSVEGTQKKEVSEEKAPASLNSSPNMTQKSRWGRALEYGAGRGTHVRRRISRPVGGGKSGTLPPPAVTLLSIPNSSSIGATVAAWDQRDRANVSPCLLKSKTDDKEFYMLVKKRRTKLSWGFVFNWMKFNYLLQLLLFFSMYNFKCKKKLFFKSLAVLACKSLRLSRVTKPIIIDFIKLKHYLFYFMQRDAFKCYSVGL